MASHRDLKCWQRAQALATRIHESTRGYASRQVPEIVDQVRRSACSVGANIAEGRGAGTNAQFRRYLDIAIASAGETDSHLDMLMNLDALPSRDVLEMRDELAIMLRMTIALKRSIPVRKQRGFSIAPDRSSSTSTAVAVPRPP